MYNVAYRITADEDDASDVLQEAFISAFDHLGFYRGDATFGSWLKRIVVNKAINLIRKRKADRLPESDEWDIADETEIEVEADDQTVERVKARSEERRVGKECRYGWELDRAYRRSS